MADFATFTPIEFNSSPSKEEIAQYFIDTNTRPEIDFLNEYFQLPPIAKAEEKPATNASTLKNFNVRSILDNFAQTKLDLQKENPAAETSSEQQESTTTTTNSPIKSKKEFLEVYGKLAEEASAKTNIPKEFILGQMALETE